MDNIVSDNVDENIAKNIPPSAASIMDHLLNDEQKNKFAPFIYKTFKVFLGNKTKITIDVNTLFWFDDSFLKYIFGGSGFKKFKYGVDDGLGIGKFLGAFSINDTNYTIPDPGDMTNIPRFDVFDNLREINMDNVQRSDIYWSFSLLSLLSMISKSSIKKINITTVGECYTHDDTTWLSYVWNNDGATIKQAFSDKRYNIQFDKTYGDDGDRHCLSIHKI